VLSLGRLVGADKHPVHLRVTNRWKGDGFDECKVRVVSRSKNTASLAFELDPRIFSLSGPKSAGVFYTTNDESVVVTHNPTGSVLMITLYEPNAKSRRSTSAKLTFEEPGNTKHFAVVRGEILKPTVEV